MELKEKEEAERIPKHKMRSQSISSVPFFARYVLKPRGHGVLFPFVFDDKYMLPLFKQLRKKIVVYFYCYDSLTHPGSIQFH